MWSILTTEDTLSKITNISYYFIKKKLKKKNIFPECRFPLILIKICHVKMTSLIYFCPRDKTTTEDHGCIILLNKIIIIKFYSNKKSVPSSTVSHLSLNHPTCSVNKHAVVLLHGREAY